MTETAPVKTILIVDDSKEIRELVKATLGEDNYSVVEANTGKMAIEMTGTLRPDLIIMDIIMPGSINGFEAIREIRKNPALKTCPVIILTGTGQRAPAGETAGIGDIEYFSKPFSPLDLIEKVENLLSVSAS